VVRALSLAALCAAAGAFAAPSDREALRKAVDALLAQPPLAGSHASVEVVSLDDGSVVYSRSAEDSLNPASNTKLVTAAAALLRLGAEYRFTTDFLADRPPDGRGRVRTLYVKGRGDPSINTERLLAFAADLWHRGVRQVDEIVLDDTWFDSERWGPGWEQETSDKAYAAPVGALSLNHNAVAIYVAPADRPGQRARVELEPDADCFVLQNGVQTVRADGRRTLRPHTFPEGERTRVAVDGRLPVKAEASVLYRRVTDPSMYFGHTLRMALRQRGIQVSRKLKVAAAPPDAALIASYDSQELADIVRDMNKMSSNFIAEMLIKTLGAEMKGVPGTWPKGIAVTEELLGEMGIRRGTYQLRNGSGLNDTNRFSAHHMTTLLGAVWKRFPVAAEFVSSLGIAARDGTMRMRMEGTDAAGRLRAKTGTLEKVTALSGFVQSLGGERFVFSILVNDWAGRSGPVITSIDRLGSLIASVGGPQPSEVAPLAPSDLSPAELRARVATYAQLAQKPDKKNLPLLRSALRTERDPLVRVMIADALVRSDPEQGGGALLEALPSSPELFVRLRAVGRELSLPVPAVSSLLDLAVDGSGEALARLLVLAPLARGAQQDESLEMMLADGLVEVADASPEELYAALHTAPAAQAQAGMELIAVGLARAEMGPARLALTRLLRAAQGADGQQAQAWLAMMEPRTAPPEVAPTVPAPAAAAQAPAVPRPAGGPPTTATAIAPIAAAAAASLTPGPLSVPASFAEPATELFGPVTMIPNPGWLSPLAPAAPAASTVPAAPAAPAAPARGPAGTSPAQGCTGESQGCSAPAAQPNG